MSSRYTADGKRRSSMTHARRAHPCTLCGVTVFGNGGVVSHGRGHVRRGEAVELVKEYEFGQSPTRMFIPTEQVERITAYVNDHGFTKVENR